MTEADAYDRLTAILREVLEHPGIVATPELTARDVVGWDSFRQVEILLSIEESLDVSLAPDEVRQLGNVGDLAAIMLRHAPAGS